MPLLLTIGVAAAGAMVKSTEVARPVTESLVPANQTVVFPTAAASGVPVIAPVAVFKDRPAGRVPLVTANEVAAGLAVRLKGVKVWPTCP